MTSKTSDVHRWGLGLKDEEAALIASGATEIDLIRNRMPLFTSGDQIKLVDWGTNQECPAEILKRLATCHYRVRITGNFEDIRNNSQSSIASSYPDEYLDSGKIA
ncbi:hypothetical protein KKA33_00570 [Patescibacteria group bacterium]|nr:hypothetical protein [Patescibacteria group bacterium]